MVKYCGHYITCQEVPDEIALTLTITRCPHQCTGCHSPWLQEDIGDELTPGELNHLVQQYRDGITCVCFMGLGDDPEHDFPALISTVHSYGLSVCVYDGDDDGDFLDYPFQFDNPGEYVLDYYKYGSYKEALGGLSSPTTNQRMLKLTPNGKYEDITSWFWRKKE